MLQEVRIQSNFEVQSLQENSEITSATSCWKLPDVHKVLTGEGVVIAILDTGIDTFHEAFKEKLQQIRGLNFIDDKSAFSTPESGGNMAAFVAAGKGFTARHMGPIASGVAPNANLIICRVGNPYKWEYVIKALEKLIEIKADWEREHKKKKDQDPLKLQWGVDVVSMSFGGTDDTLTGKHRCKLQELIKKLSQLKVILVAAASNYGQTLFPANHPNVFSVGALNTFNKPAELNLADVYAPSVNIATPLVHTSDRVAKASGTACAAPAIAGLVALKIQFERNKHELLKDVNKDHYVQEILKGENIDFQEIKCMFKDMQIDVDRPHVLDPYNYFKIKCHLNIALHNIIAEEGKYSEMAILLISLNMWVFFSLTNYFQLGA